MIRSYQCRVTLTLAVTHLMSIIPGELPYLLRRQPHVVGWSEPIPVWKCVWYKVLRSMVWGILYITSKYEAPTKSTVTLYIYIYLYILVIHSYVLSGPRGSPINM